MGKKKEDDSIDAGHFLYGDEDEFKESWLADHAAIIMFGMMILVVIAIAVVFTMHCNDLENMEELAIQKVGCADAYTQDGYVYCLFEGTYIPLKYNYKDERFYPVKVVAG